ncbi:hypothetical protein QCA50_020250 [Cerrena zonata]|uniref:Uncharacterized protein n=1 Tax=Cerrena zonata TaxID=2478898 RepID=A0AAW0FHV7_9APHY
MKSPKSPKPSLIPREEPARRALSIALSYAHLADKYDDILLETALHDTPKIRDLLIDVYGFNESDITVMCDDDPENPSTRGGVVGT